MDTFNIAVGIVGIVSLFFAIYVFVDSRKKEAVELQKAAEYRQRIADLQSLANAAAKQGMLLATLADRDDVSKKELKHLAIAQSATIASLQSSLERTSANEARWEFGIPTAYVELRQLEDGTK